MSVLGAAALGMSALGALSQVQANKENKELSQQQLKMQDPVYQSQRLTQAGINPLLYFNNNGVHGVNATSPSQVGVGSSMASAAAPIGVGASSDLQQKQSDLLAEDLKTKHLTNMEQLRGLKELRWLYNKETSYYEELTTRTQMERIIKSVEANQATWMNEHRDEVMKLKLDTLHANYNQLYQDIQTSKSTELLQKAYAAYADKQTGRYNDYMDAWVENMKSSSEYYKALAMPLKHLHGSELASYVNTYLPLVINNGAQLLETFLGGKFKLKVATKFGEDAMKRLFQQQ